MKGTMLFAICAAAGMAFAENVKPSEPQNVPELLVSSAGERIVTSEQWERVRRPEIVKTLQEQ